MSRGSAYAGSGSRVVQAALVLRLLARGGTAVTAAQQGGNGWRHLAAGLRHYPLYPYLPAAALEHDIERIDLATVTAYLQRYPDWIPADELRHSFLLELARRQDWKDFLVLYQPGLGDTLACDECGAEFEVVGVDPLELSRVEADYEDEDEVFYNEEEEEE